MNSDKACAQLNTALKKHVQNGGFLKFELKVNKETFNFYGRGSKGLTLEDPQEIVLRKSYFESPRTASIRCNAAAIDIPRHIIEMLKNPVQKGTLTIVPAQGEAEDSSYPVWTLP